MGKHLEIKKKAWAVLPYVYFIGLAAFWLLSEIFAMQQLSYLALGIILVLLAQAIAQNKTIGAALGICAVAVSFFFFLAVLSEFSEFEVLSTRAIQLIAVGSILTLSGLAMGAILTINSIKRLNG